MVISIHFAAIVLRTISKLIFSWCDQKLAEHGYNEHQKKPAFSQTEQVVRVHWAKPKVENADLVRYQWQTGCGVLDQIIEIFVNVMFLHRWYKNPISLRHIWERWRCGIRYIRIILIEKELAITAGRRMCFFCHWEMIARFKNSFSACVAMRRAQAASRNQRKYAQQEIQHAAQILRAKRKLLSHI